MAIDPVAATVPATSATAGGWEIGSWLGQGEGGQSDDREGESLSDTERRLKEEVGAIETLLNQAGDDVPEERREAFNRRSHAIAEQLRRIEERRKEEAPPPEPGPLGNLLDAVA